MNQREFKYGVAHIADAAGLPLDKVRRHVRDKVFRLDKFAEVVKYTSGHMLLNCTSCKEEEQ